MLNSLKKEYENFYKEIEVSPNNDLESPWYKLCLENLSISYGEKILEVACGRGFLINHLTCDKRNVVGVDFSQSALRFGKTRSQDMNINPNFICASIYNLPFKDNNFDIVISCETLEHLEFPFKALKEIIRTSKNKAFIFVTTPNYFNFVGITRFLFSFSGKKWCSGNVIQPIEQPFMWFILLHYFKACNIDILKTDSLVFWIPILKEKPKKISDFLNYSKYIDITRLLNNIKILNKYVKYFGFHFAVMGLVRK